MNQDLVARLLEAEVTGVSEYSVSWGKKWEILGHVLSRPPAQEQYKEARQGHGHCPAADEAIDLAKDFRQTTFSTAGLRLKKTTRSVPGEPLHHSGRYG